MVMIHHEYVLSLEFLSMAIVFKIEPIVGFVMHCFFKNFLVIDKKLGLFPFHFYGPGTKSLHQETIYI